MSEYPEHSKLKAIAKELDALNRFLDWCEDEHQAHLYKMQEFTELSSDIWGDPCLDDKGNPKTYKTERLAEFMPRRENLMALYFGIDQKVLEDEKRAMLRALCGENEGGDD